MNRRRDLRDRAKRRLLVALGIACVGLGTIGIVVPGLPTTVFLLAASFLFARSSPRLHRRLAEHPRLGTYLELARGRSMPLRAKLVSLAALWLGVGSSATIGGVVSPAVRAAVIVLGLIGTAAIVFGMRTAPRLPQAR